MFANADDKKRSNAVLPHNEPIFVGFLREPKSILHRSVDDVCQFPRIYTNEKRGTTTYSITELVSTKLLEVYVLDCVLRVNTSWSEEETLQLTGAYQAQKLWDPGHPDH